MVQLHSSSINSSISIRRDPHAVPFPSVVTAGFVPSLGDEILLMVVNKLNVKSATRFQSYTLFN